MISIPVDKGRGVPKFCGRHMYLPTRYEVLSSCLCRKRGRLTSHLGKGCGTKLRNSCGAHAETVAVAGNAAETGAETFAETVVEHTGWARWVWETVSETFRNRNLFRNCVRNCFPKLFLTSDA